MDKGRFMAVTSDEKLMALVKNADVESFSLLVERYRRQLFVFIAPYVKWDMAHVEELVQRVFVRVYEKRDSFKKNKAFRPWIYRIARNMSLNYIRDMKKKQQVQLSPTIKDDEETPERQLLKREDARLLVAAAKKLPLRQREVVDMLRQSFSYQEISAILGISEAAARNNLRHALLNLKKIMETEKKAFTDGKLECIH